jgi:hypothetical protein
MEEMLSHLGPYLVVSPLLTLTFALYGTVVRRGPLVYVAGAITGFLWSLLAGIIAAWLERNASVTALSANISVFGCIIALGLLVGSGIYVLVFQSVLREPSATNAVLSAIMRPTVPFYIAINSAMELVFLPFVLLLNWNAEPARRWIVVVACVLYVAQRVWTYLVYAERRLATGTAPLSQSDVDWYKRTLASDYRVILNAVIFVLFTAAAFFRPAM